MCSEGGPLGSAGGQDRGGDEWPRAWCASQ